MSSKRLRHCFEQLLLDPIPLPSINGHRLRPDAPRRQWCRLWVFYLYFCLPSFLWTTISLKASDRAAATHPLQGPFMKRKGQLLPWALASCWLLCVKKKQSFPQGGETPYWCAWLTSTKKTALPLPSNCLLFQVLRMTFLQEIEPSHSHEAPKACTWVLVSGHSQYGPAKLVLTRFPLPAHTCPPPTVRHGVVAGPFVTKRTVFQLCRPPTPALPNYRGIPPPQDPEVPCL